MTAELSEYEEYEARKETKIGDVVQLGSTPRNRRYWVVGTLPTLGSSEGQFPEPTVILYPIMTTSLHPDEIQIGYQGSSESMRYILQLRLETKLPLDVLRKGVEAYARASLSEQILESLRHEPLLPFETKLS